MSDSGNTINQIFQPVLNESTIADWGVKIVNEIVKVFRESLNWLS